MAINRLSVSNWVSPGPRRPIPPLCLSRCDQPRTNLVERYFNWAISTWSFPSLVLARFAKISKINATLSITLQFKNKVRFLCCTGLRGSENITNSTQLFLQWIWSSLAFPLDRKKDECTLFFFDSNKNSTRQPAEWAKEISSWLSVGRWLFTSKILTSPTLLLPSDRSMVRFWSSKGALLRTPPHFERKQFEFVSFIHQ